MADSGQFCRMVALLDRQQHEKTLECELEKDRRAIERDGTYALGSCRRGINVPACFLPLYALLAD